MVPKVGGSSPLGHPAVSPQLRPHPPPDARAALPAVQRLAPHRRATTEQEADDAVLEFPQGRERIRGEANIIAFRSAYPARVAFQMHRTIGRQDLWVNEYTIRYNDENPLNVVGIMEFRDGKVVRERIYFGEPWEPPAWRARWVEPMEEPGAPKASA